MIRGVDGRGCSPRLQVALLPDNGTKSMKLLAVAAVKEEEEEKEGRGDLQNGWQSGKHDPPRSSFRSIRPVLCHYLLKI